MCVPEEMLVVFVGQMRQTGQDLKNHSCVHFPPAVGSICEPGVLDPGPALVRYLLSDPEHVVGAHPVVLMQRWGQDKGAGADRQHHSSCPEAQCSPGEKLMHWDLMGRKEA